MPTPITINVRNNSLSAQSFFFFQAPAIYSGGSEFYTNSLYTQTLLPYSQSGAVLTFSLVLQFLAGVQQQVQPPVVGQPSGQLAASQPIGLTPAPGGAPTNNTTTMILPSLGLTIPVSTQGPQPGSFRIVTPPFNPALQSYNAGSAIQNVSGGITLSNFVTALPNSNLDCQPVLQFYVATGNYTPGTVMNFTSSSATAALCDATPGYQSFNVTYNSDGTWTVQPSAALRVSRANAPPIAPPVAPPNAEILNEAGTGVVAQGYAGNFNAPVMVTDLVPPNSVDRLKEYQVGPVGGPYRGRTCTYVDYLTDSATFS
ncbi:hypothetical protein [Methylobacterium nigriterrae]|uniref:hypothetical protein n=1 Tax=Methylobacterium nigriterrae TaxID=3127512 RepID=UPI00301345A3